MFGELVTTFRQRIEQDGFCRANLHVDGLATQVSVVYLPGDRMDIFGLPADMPPYLSFAGEEVYLDSERTQQLKDEDERGFYLLYRTWDPRVIAQAGPEEQMSEEGVALRWKARYYLEKAVRVTSSIEASFEAGEIPRMQEVEFVPYQGRLRELSVWDFSAHSRKLTLVFSYRDNAESGPMLRTR